MGTTPSDDNVSDNEKQRPVDVEAAAAHGETQDVYDEEESGVDPVYQAKARILNDAFQEIGMGKYQVGFSCIVYTFSVSSLLPMKCGTRLEVKL